MVKDNNMENPPQKRPGISDETRRAFTEGAGLFWLRGVMGGVPRVAEKRSPCSALRTAHSARIGGTSLRRAAVYLSTQTPNTRGLSCRWAACPGWGSLPRS